MAVTTTDRNNQPLVRGQAGNRPGIGWRAHNQSIYGQTHGPYATPSGGHVWREDLGRRPSGLPAEYGNGQHIAPPSDARHYWENGVYRHPNPQIETSDGRSLARTVPHTMFPIGLGPAEVRRLANEAWNGGRPFYGFDGATNRWTGFTFLPNNQPIHITGHATNGVVHHYYPDNPQ